MIDFDSINLAEIRSLIKNGNVQIVAKRKHEKASEMYIDVVFAYPESKKIWKGSVPIEYRRTGVSATNSREIAELIETTYALVSPSNYDAWLREQNAFWSSSNKEVTRPFFDQLSDCEWKCRGCDLPENPNWARRFQDIKEIGYTIATDTRRRCDACKKKITHLIMLPLPRGHGCGYETWSPKLRKRILSVLGNIDTYENRWGASLLPDHKFPEIRWDENTKQENPDGMSDQEIREKFQLLSNQRNQQKREACRNCFQTGRRGYPFGIRFFHEGNENWPANVPKKGKGAEKGCRGCGWYDLNLWREKLNESVRASGSS